jgi:hypothetical protein
MDECGAIVDSSTVSKGSVNPVPALRCGLCDRQLEQRSGLLPVPVPR